MPHPELDNQTPFSFEPLFVADEDGRPVVAPIVKGTFDVSPGGEVSLSDVQHTVRFAGEAYGEPGSSSYRLEPEVAFVKLATDVVLLGHAYAPYHGANRADVQLSLGPVAKTVRVWGNRHVIQSVSAGISEPEPFERIPLIYERAFGGWDRTPDDPGEHEFEARNPVGVGFRAKNGRVTVGEPLPNLEDPADPLTSLTDRPTPAGFGFLSPDWHPRASLAGTYDGRWESERAPLLPADFDRRFFNAASTGMIVPGYLQGGEPVSVRHATPEGHWEFFLPRIANPRCLIVCKRHDDQILDTKLDTVMIDADEGTVTMMWRGFTGLWDGPLDVTAIRVSSANISREG